MNLKHISSALFVVCSIGLFVSITGCTSQEEKDATAKANADIARIRELKEKEAASTTDREAKADAYKKADQEASRQPLREIK